MILTSIALALASAAEAAPSGSYVEARTAAVYAGACHFGGQYTTQGREAVIGWHFDSGEHDGTDLTGVNLVVVLSSTANLEVEQADRRAVVYLDAHASPEARAASRAWLVEHHAALVGDVLAVRAVEVHVGREAEAFWLTAGETVVLSGTALPERECCKMPYNVWYTPLAPARDCLVGNTASFALDEQALGRRFSRAGGNDAFFGSF